MFDIKIHATGSNGNCYSLIDGNRKLLIEAGLNIKQIIKSTKYQLSNYDGCLISHEHSDHARAIHELNKIGIPCYMSEGTKQALECKAKIITVSSIFRIGEWKVKAFKLIHDSLEPLGFLILSPSGKKILYISDTKIINHYFIGITHYMIESNYIKELIDMNDELPEKVKQRIINNHFEFTLVKNFFSNQDMTKTEKIYLIHLSEANSNEKIMVDAIESITGKPVYTG